MTPNPQTGRIKSITPAHEAPLCLGLRAALALPFEADAFGVLHVANRVLGADIDKDYDPIEEVSDPVPAIEDVLKKRFIDYGERCLDCNPTMAEFIRYMQTRELDAFGRATMRKHCPAWILPRSSVVTLDPASLIVHAWLEN